VPGGRKAAPVLDAPELGQQRVAVALAARGLEGAVGSVLVGIESHADEDPSAARANPYGMPPTDRRLAANAD